MNERIKDLMIQTDNHFGWCLASEDLVWCEKFAELIVRECAFAAQNKDDNSICLRYGRAVAAGKILEYFGVEA